ncbi:MAG: twin-arginine translocation signal domain-containing protein [Chloroflexi bacterium]|nr:twin-arginine translocation signal domain-containing protein [Chloroflexota bacterium]MDA1270445.1 twin-arginine translocation signal domain-containing protein [Chloroflexota bacterium]PKB59224.1 MAG: hypothetical protein BZY83_03010 [SAR202 cluster bacterium Casp-Chloro-G2]
MANQIEPEEKSGQTRRSFLAKMGLGAAALAVIGVPLGMLGRSKNDEIKTTYQSFPDETSIFHPASDPTKDPRRS